VVDAQAHSMFALLVCAFPPIRSALTVPSPLMLSCPAAVCSRLLLNRAALVFVCVLVHTRQDAKRTWEYSLLNIAGCRGSCTLRFCFLPSPSVCCQLCLPLTWGRDVVAFDRA